MNQAQIHALKWTILEITHQENEATLNNSIHVKYSEEVNSLRHNAAWGSLGVAMTQTRGLQLHWSRLLIMKMFCNLIKLVVIQLFQHIKCHGTMQFKVQKKKKKVAAQFTIAEKWNEPRCLSIDDQTKKMWYIYIYTLGYHLVIKRKE